MNVVSQNGDLAHEIKLLKETLQQKLEDYRFREEASEEENDDLAQQIKHLENDRDSRIESNARKEEQIIELHDALIKEVEKVDNSSAMIEELLKRKEITNKIINDLQSENLNLKKNLVDESNDNKNLIGLKENNQEHINKLLKEMEEIQKVNKTKENMLEEIIIEKESFKQKQDELERENMVLKEELEKHEVKNLSEELGIFDRRSLNVSFECDNGEEEVLNLKTHKQHKHEEKLKDQILKFRLREIELEKLICSQNVKLTHSLIQLKEQEVSDAWGCKIPKCKRYCRIYHQKHNWRKSYSTEIVDKLRTMNLNHPCENCDKTFYNVECLKEHVKSVHQDHVANLTTVSGGEINGGVIVVNPSCSSGGRLIGL